MTARQAVRAGLCAFALFAAAAHAQTVAKIAFVDPLSGPFANIGKNGLSQLQYAVERANRTRAAGDVRLEVMEIDNKGTPQGSLDAVKRAMDSGVRYIVQGNGSGAGMAIMDAINKHNERNPGQELLYLNYSAQDPVMTNEKCSFWHFRFEANSDMKMESLTSFMAKDKAIRKVYLINQNYAFGQQVTRAAKEYLARKRPDIQVVGDELHPLGQVRDFAPYVAKIKSSGADTIVTANWGNDLALLVKAIRENGVDATIYTLGGGYWGSPTAIGDSGVGKLKWLAEWMHDLPNVKTGPYAQGFKDKFGVDYALFRIDVLVSMLAEAMKRSKSADPVKVAFALEGMKLATDTGEVEMRAADHQIQNPMFIGTMVKTAAKGGDKSVKYDLEGVGLGFRNDARIDTYVGSQPTSCQMQRPSRG
ncbi:MAG TPA: branched-chain amino acid ABC transporter substrate-binding protein [Ramlibacter sp.]|nr:branched-chain amino acid ABC transporter substrate-binding protein [Ramlibacter sp.]